MTTVLFIRHGQNDFVGSGRLAGWLPNVHLNDVGRAQAQALAEGLAGFKLDAMFASPLERTVETAEPIARAQGLQVNTRLGLGEIQYGRWQGRTLKSLRKLKSWRRIQYQPSLARFPEGESFPQAQARIVADVEELRSQHSGKRAIIACVSHADMIKLAVAHYIGLPLDLFQRLVIEPGSVSVLSIGKDHIRLIRLNDTRLVRSVQAK
ncbi:MAG: histidine phosphatase family protein [Anaerolineales bacterium]